MIGAFLLAAATAMQGPLALDCVRVLVPCYVCSKTIVPLLSLAALNRKKHNCMSVVVFVDWEEGDPAVRSAISALCEQKGLRCTVLSSKTRMGPSHSKYQLFMYAAISFEANDLAMVVDGDDNFADDGVVATVASAMQKAGAWVSMGRIRGKYDDQCMIEFNPQTPIRNATWSFCHPRTMKVGILRYFTADMFKMDGRWMEKVTDRSWLYAAVDVATNRRVLKITDRPLVVYNSRVDSTASRVSFAYKQRALAHTASHPASPSSRTVHLVSIVNSRLYFLKKWVRKNVVDQIPALKELGWSLHVHFYAQNEQAGLHAQTMCYAIRNIHETNCSSEVHEKNEGPWYRYVYVAGLYRHTLMDYVVMIDDDLVLKNKNGLARVWQQRQTKTMLCWYGKIFGDTDDYWTTRYRTNDMRGAMNGECPHIKRFDYCGAGLSLVDASFFRAFEYLTRSTPIEYRFVEDLASSWLLTKLGWAKRRLFTPVADMNYDHPKSNNKNGLWNTNFIRQKKSDFLQLLRKKGWKPQYNRTVLDSCLSKRK